ncbi:PEP-CTERM sorting domain-containing protein [Aureliella helgolandensis]|uniref:Ice-binding protein C-terminal domain-containing protein n=1 Tax=Aureliella helgolandensis TaxID=2527968 RepID=A0A518G067_9BACT|nr:PEP-CTERM sorting domain-containing protein [Aureliella helgolandensis]QDV21914.1 hypothetical protein Q31a_01930 [Aureliella helgolandensis]
MKKILLAALIVFATSASQVQAAIIGSAIAIPDAEVLIDFNNTGLDWTYAGPVAPNEFGPGQIEAPSFRAAEGWRFATLAEWAIKPIWEDFTKPGQATPSAAGGYSNHSVYRFTSEYWSNFTHVDLNNANDGRITNGSDIGSLNNVWETWYVRDTRVATVPEPASLAIWGFGVACMSVSLRRRRN